MSDQDTATAASTATDAPTVDDAATADATNTGTGTDDAQNLGDAGKKALDVVRAERAAAKKEAREAKAALTEAQAELAKLRGGNTEAQANADAAAKAVAEATQKANQRILRAEIKAAAGSKLSDPADAIRLLDLDQFEVGADGEIDAKEIADAIDDLLKAKPYLAATATSGGRRFPASADGGARSGSQTAQLTVQDLKRMTPEQIVEARLKGQLDDLL